MLLQVLLPRNLELNSVQYYSLTALYSLICSTPGFTNRDQLNELLFCAGIMNKPFLFYGNTKKLLKLDDVDIKRTLAVQYNVHIASYSYMNRFSYSFRRELKGEDDEHYKITPSCSGRSISFVEDSSRSGRCVVLVVKNMNDVMY